MNFNSMQIELYGITKDDAIAQSICIRCKKHKDGTYEDDLDESEYHISGLCPPCFAEICGPDDDPDYNSFVEGFDSGYWNEPVLSAATADFTSPAHVEAQLWEALQSVSEVDPKYDFDTISSKHAIRGAEALNKQVLFPEPDELFLDIDTPQQLQTLIKNLSKFDLHLGNKVCDIRVKESNTVGHYHVVLTLEKEMHQARFLYQALLGSDPTRELLSFVRFKNEDEHPTLFIEQKQLLLTDGNI